MIDPRNCLKCVPTKKLSSSIITQFIVEDGIVHFDVLDDTPSYKHDGVLEGMLGSNVKGFIRWNGDTVTLMENTVITCVSDECVMCEKEDDLCRLMNY